MNKFKKPVLYAFLPFLFIPLFYNVLNKTTSDLSQKYSNDNIAQYYQEDPNIIAPVKAKYQVNNSGAATYSYPIEVPPGRQKVAPRLSLEYNHMASNGIFGKGFKLKGLSVISRVPASKVIDGFTGDVQNNELIEFDGVETYSYRYAIDGERMIAIEDDLRAPLNKQKDQNQAYAQEGTKYLTRNQNWVRIETDSFDMSHANTGPKRFKVYNKDGSVMTYEGGSLLRFQQYKDRNKHENAYYPSKYSYNLLAGPPPPPQTDLFWLLTKVEDKFGNYYSVTYQEVNSNEFNVVKIDYTGYQPKSSLNKEKNVSPTRSVLFSYDPRRDPSTKYVAGQKVESTTILSSIETYVNNKRIRQYQFDYIFAPYSQRSLLKSITPLDQFGHPLAPVTFTWDAEKLIKYDPLFYHRRHQDIEKSPYPNFQFQTDQDIVEQYATGKPLLWLQYFQEEMAGRLGNTTDELNFLAPQGFYLDIDNDGYPDYVRSVTSPIDNVSFVDFGYPKGGKPSKKRLQLPCHIIKIVDQAGKAFYSGKTAAFTDLNGDGLLDLVHSVYNATTGHYTNDIWFYNGNDYVKQNIKFPQNYSLFWESGQISENSTYQTLELGSLEDINGDGLMDFIKGTITQDGTNPMFNHPLIAPHPTFSLNRASAYNSLNNTLNSRVVFLNRGKGIFEDGLKSLKDLSQKGLYVLPAPLYILCLDPKTKQYRRFKYGNLIDINGDQKLDYFSYKELVDETPRIETPKDMNRVNPMSFFLLQGSNWLDGDFQFPGPIFIDGTLVDLNGDNLLDYIVAEGKCYLNTGKSFVVSDKYVIPYDVEWGKNFNTILEDFNGDGLPDLIDISSNSIAFNTGGGFAHFMKVNVMNHLPKTMTDATYQTPFSSIFPTYTNVHVTVPNGSLLDLNGDNVLDFVYNYTIVGETGKDFKKDNGSLYDTSSDYYKQHLGLSYSKHGAALGIAPENIIVDIDEGQHRSINISYQKINEPSTYDSYPQVKLNYPSSLVVKDTIRWGKASNQFVSNTYQYIGNKLQMTGPGSGLLGFEKIIIDNEQRGERRIREFYHDYPFIRHLKSQAIQYFDKGANRSNDLPFLEHKTDYLYTQSKKYFNVIDIRDSIITHTNKHQGKVVKTSFTKYEYDPYGNIRWILNDPNTADDDPLKYTHKRYFNKIDEHAWQIGILTEEKVSTSPTAQFNDWDGTVDLDWKRYFYYSDHYGMKGGLKSKWRYNDENDTNVEVNYYYDQFGNVIKVKDPANGYSSTTFDPVHFTFPAIVRNADPKTGSLSDPSTVQTKEFIYSPFDGALVSKTDENGIIRSQTVDALGRNISHSMALPSAPNKPKLLSTTSRYLQHDTLVEKQQKMIWRNQEQQPSLSDILQRNQKATSVQWTFKDYKGQMVKEVRTCKSCGSEDDLIITENHYDASGKLVLKSFPFLKGQKADWTKYTYQADHSLESIIAYAGTKNERTTTFKKNYTDNIVYKTEAAGTPKASTSSYFLDDQGNILILKDTTGGTTIFEYDLSGQLTSIKDPIGVENVTKYNSLGLKRSIFNPDTDTTLYTYNEAGQMASRKDANGNLIKYYYDYLGRISSKVSTQSELGKETITYSYDEDNIPGTFNKGRLTSVQIIRDIKKPATKKTINYRFAYDWNGKMVHQEMQLDDQTYAQSNVYAPNGQPLLQIMPDSTIINYKYGQDGLLSEVESGIGGAQLAYKRYSADGKVMQTHFGNGWKSNKTYSSGGLIEEHQIIANGGNTVWDHQYHWDERFNIDTITNKINPANTQVFSYDGVNRLLHASISYQEHSHKLSYQYDAGGNILNKDEASYIYFNNNGLPTHRVQNYSGYHLDMSFNYDYNGNTIAKSGQYRSGQVVNQNYQYDWHNNLTHIIGDKILTNSTIKDTIHYTYNHLGKVVAEHNSYKPESSTVHVGDQFKIVKQGDTLQYFSYLNSKERKAAFNIRTSIGKDLLRVSPFHSQKNIDPWTLSEEKKGTLKILGFFNELSNLQYFSKAIGLILLLFLLLFAYYQIIRKYLWPLRKEKRRISWVRLSSPLMAVVLLFTFLSLPYTQLKASTIMPISENGVEAYYLHSNQVNNTNIITNEHGTVVYEALYKPFGEVAFTSVDQNNYQGQMEGHRFDSFSNLYHLGARFYDPALGRFISADNQVGNAPFAPSAYNRYAFGANNPISNMDPSGHGVLSFFGGVIIGALIGALASFIINLYFQVQFNPNGKINWKKLMESTLVGAVGGAIAGLVGPIFGSLAGDSFGGLIIAGAGTGLVAQIGANLVNEGIFHNHVSWGTSLAIAVGLGGLSAGIAGEINASEIEAQAAEITIPDDPEAISDDFWQVVDNDEKAFTDDEYVDNKHYGIEGSPLLEEEEEFSDFNFSLSKVTKTRIVSFFASSIKFIGFDLIKHEQKIEKSFNNSEQKKKKKK